MREMNVAEVKRDFREILDAAERGEVTVILRRGKAVAMVAPVQQPRGALPVARRPGGLLSIIGLFDDWDAMAEDMAEVVAARQSTLDRPPLELE